MKCPKCGYLGFETTDRCRNCGYDFSLSVQIESASELPLRDAGRAESALADFDLSDLGTGSRTVDPAGGLDLDRLLGGTDTPVPAEPAAPSPPRHPPAAADSPAMSRERVRGVETSSAVATPPPADLQAQYATIEDSGDALPLFVEPEPAPPTRPPSDNLRRPSDADVSPLITPPRPARPPLAVRRATPEVQRRRTPRPVRREAGDLSLELEPTRSADATPRDGVSAVPEAPRVARLVAALADLVLLGGIDAAILYLTLAIAGLSFDRVAIIPPVPMGAFLLLLNGGYLIAFTTAGGQTIGKMLTGTRVLGDDGRAVDVGGAVLRALGCAVSLLTLGLGYLPAFVTSDGRALHDRLAGTRVVKT